MKKIIVNADDFGSSGHYNQAIINAYKNGFLTSTSVITNGKAYKKGIKELIKECPDIGLGVHLNLIEGRSELAEREQFFSIYKDGFYNLSFLKVLLFSFNKRFLKQVELEFRNQIEVCLEDFKVDHLNSHGHCASIPKIFDISCRLADEYGIQNLRVPKEKVVFTKDSSKFFKPSFSLNIIKLLVLRFFSVFNNRSIKKFGLKTTDNFCGSLYTGFMDKSVIIKAIKKLKDNEAMEILLHPCEFSGNCSDEYLEGDRDYAVSYNRIDELKLLLDFDLCSYVLNSSQLITFDDLSNAEQVSNKLLTLKNVKSREKKSLNVFIIFDETTFFHPHLLHKLINDIDLVNCVGALRVTSPKGGTIQSYLIKKWKQLGFLDLFKLAAKTLIWKLIDLFPPFIKGSFSSSVKSTLIRNKISFKTINKIDEETISFIKSKKPDVILSSNSLIFSKEVLDIPRICCINRHSSLLPSYGGILPVFRSIQFQEEYCGASIHVMDEGIDTGPVLSRKFLPIYQNDSLFILYRMLFVLSFVAIEEALNKIIEGKLEEDLEIKDHNLTKSYFSYPNNSDWKEFKRNGGSFI
jgi:methionyl-tRNA formyltransferase